MNPTPEVSWIEPSLCDPPHKVTHPEKFIDLCGAFCGEGWDINEPPLLGYPIDNKIQLISGSHRWAAALEANIKIPIIVYSYDWIYEIWGSDTWLHILENAKNIKYKFTK